MWTSIQTKQFQLSPRMRQTIEKYVRRALRREQRHIGSIVLNIRPATFGPELGYRCRARVWSHHLGTIVVNEFGHTVRTATQQAIARARHAIRRKLQRRLTKNRRIKISRIHRWLPDSALD